MSIHIKQNMLIKLISANDSNEKKETRVCRTDTECTQTTMQVAITD